MCGVLYLIGVVCTVRDREVADVHPGGNIGVTTSGMHVAVGAVGAVGVTVISDTTDTTGRSSVTAVTIGRSFANAVTIELVSDTAVIVGR